MDVWPTLSQVVERRPLHLMESRGQPKSCEFSHSTTRRRIPSFAWYHCVISTLGGSATMRSCVRTFSLVEADVVVRGCL
jgi:hypothetical protein